VTSLYRPEKSRVAFLEHHEIEIEMLKETLHEIETETPATRNDESAPLLVGLCIGRRSQEGKSAGTVQQNRMSSWSSLLVAAVWCIVVAACMGQEQCRSGTFTTADYLRGDCKLDLGELSTAELRQICARTGFEEAMTVIRRRQRDDPAPNREDLIVEAEKCLVLDVMRSSDPKKWARDIVSLSYEQYVAVSGRENDIRRNIFVKLFQNWALLQTERTLILFSLEQEQEWSAAIGEIRKLAVGLSILSDEEIPNLKFMSLSLPARTYANIEIHRVVDSVQLDENDEMHLILMLLNISPNTLERLISGDVPDLKSMQQPMTVYWITASILSAIVLTAFGCALLLKWSGTVTRNSRERDGEGRRVKGGAKKKGGRKRMRIAEGAARN